jgi:pimeloyl-ACP methyl ester carboxylesterase
MASTNRAGSSQTRRRKWRRRVLVGVVLLLTAIPLLVRFVAPLLIPGGLIYAPNTRVMPDPDRDPDRRELTRLGVSEHRRLTVGSPPVSLSVFLVEPPAAGSRRSVLVLHGIRDSKRSMLGWGRRLADAGYRAILVDLRGHGGSSGRHLSYGVREQRDLSELLDALRERGPVGVLGHSYGAATALQLAAGDRRIEAVVAISSFTRLREVAHLYLGRYLLGLSGLIPRDEVDRRVDQAGREAGFDPDAASPLDAVRTTRAAVLLIHGERDRSIPAAHSRTLYRAASPPKRLVVVRGEGHNSVMADRRGVLREEAIRWLERWLPLRGIR